MVDCRTLVQVQAQVQVRYHEEIVIEIATDRLPVQVETSGPSVSGFN